MVSKGLAELSQRGFQQAIEEGFITALDIIDDIVLDIPTATELMSKFLARAVVDEVGSWLELICADRDVDHCPRSLLTILSLQVIPPAFLKNNPITNKRAIDALTSASNLVAEKHSRFLFVSAYSSLFFCRFSSSRFSPFFLFFH